MGEQQGGQMREEDGRRQAWTDSSHQMVRAASGEVREGILTSFLTSPISIYYSFIILLGFSLLRV